jgi:DNA-binding beta-propeller fold protein YncE
VGAEDGAQVDVIDGAARKAVASVRVGRRPRGIACELDGTLIPIDTATRTAGMPIATGPSANGVVVSPDGHTVYVSSGRGARVDVVDTEARHGRGRPAAVEHWPSHRMAPGCTWPTAARKRRP